MRSQRTGHNWSDLAQSHSGRSKVIKVRTGIQTHIPCSLKFQTYVFIPKFSEGKKKIWWCWWIVLNTNLAGLLGVEVCHSLIASMVMICHWSWPLMKEMALGKDWSIRMTILYSGYWFIESNKEKWEWTPSRFISHRYRLLGKEAIRILLSLFGSHVFNTVTQVCQCSCWFLYCKQRCDTFC